MKKILLATMMATAMGGALAQSTGDYMEAAYGATRYEVDCPGTKCDKSGKGFKVLGGVGIGAGFSAELGYLVFGEASATISNVRYVLETDATYLGAAYKASFGRGFGGAVRVGVANASSVISDGTNYDSVNLYVGLTASYAVTPKINVNLNVDVMRTPDVAIVEHGTLRMISLGAGYNF